MNHADGHGGRYSVTAMVMPTAPSAAKNTAVLSQKRIRPAARAEALSPFPPRAAECRVFGVLGGQQLLHVLAAEIAELVVGQPLRQPQVLIRRDAEVSRPRTGTLIS